MKLRKVKRRHYSGLTKRTWKIIGWSAAAVGAVAVGTWLYYYLNPPTQPWINPATGQPLTTAQMSTVTPTWGLTV